MKLRNPFKRKKKGVEVPKKWVENKPSTKQMPQLVHIETRKPRKLRVPGLKTGKRAMAGLMLAFNLLLALSGLAIPNAQILSFLFFLNSFYLLDYLQKTKREKIEWSEQK